MRIAVFDIETAMGLKADYSVVLCGVVKEVGKEPVVFDKGRRGDNDKKLVKTIRDELEKYDILIGHYSSKFDLPYLNARLLFWGLPKISGKLHIDTYTLARRALQISSRRLGSIVKFLKLGSKVFNDAETWRRAGYTNDKHALKKIVEHCVQDVILTERVCDKLKGFMRGISMTY